MSNLRKDNYGKLYIGITSIVSLTFLTIILTYLGHFSPVLAYGTTIVIIAVASYYFKSMKELEAKGIEKNKLDLALSAIEKAPLPKKYDKLVDTVIEGIRKGEISEGDVNTLVETTKEIKKNPKKEGKK